MALPKIQANSQTEARLLIRRTFQAPREEVFAAWTQEEALKQWWGPEGCTAEVAVFDPRCGGRFRIGTCQNEAGEKLFASGEFLEITPPEKVVFTWQWDEGGPHEGLTRVSVEFHDRGGATELVLTHESFPSEEIRDLHGMGWTSALNCLDVFLS